MKKILEVVTNDDVRMSLQLSTPRIVGEFGERDGECEMVLLLEDLASAAEDTPWIATCLTAKQLDRFIQQLQAMKQKLFSVSKDA